jgi:hypothetical protein
MNTLPSFLRDYIAVIPQTERTDLPGTRLTMQDRRRNTNV